MDSTHLETEKWNDCGEFLSLKLWGVKLFAFCFIMIMFLQFWYGELLFVDVSEACKYCVINVDFIANSQRFSSQM